MVFRTGYTQAFRPRYLIETGPLWLANLFVNPGFNHYYFGNYYSYRGNRQIYPWVNYYQRSRGYDPLFSYYAYQDRNTNFIRQIARVERQIANNPQLRARATVAAQLRALDGIQGPQASWALRATQLSALAADNNLDFDTPFRFASVDADRRKEIVSSLSPARNFTQQRRELERAVTREDRQRAVRAEVNADVRNGNREDQRNNDPNAGAAVSSDVKRLTIRADEGANGQRRLDKADPNRPARNDVGRADNNRPDNNRPDRDPANQPQDNQPNTKRPNNNQPKDNSRPADDKRKDENPNVNRPNDNTPGANRPDSKLPGANQPSGDRPNREQPNREQPNREQPNREQPDRRNPNAPNPNLPGPNSPNANTDQRGRAATNNSALDRIHQGLDDKTGPDDARALRDMMRRNQAAQGNAGGKAPSTNPGNIPNNNPSNLPNAGNANPGRRVPNSPAQRPPNLPRQNLGNPGGIPSGIPGGNPGGAGRGPGAGNPGAGNPAVKPGGGRPGANPGAAQPGPAKPGAGNAGGNRGAGNGGPANPGAAKPGPANPGPANPGPAKAGGGNGGGGNRGEGKRAKD